MKMDQYRTVLEVLKLADLKTIRTSTAVSSTWCQAAFSEELYRDKCEAEIFGFNSQVSYLSAKVMYQSYLQTQTQIVRVTSRTVNYFSCKRQKWDKPVFLRRTLKVDDGSSWTLLPDGNILSCGGCDPCSTSDLSEVYLLLSEGEVDELTQMNETKHNHKCIFFKNAVYVFGGDHDEGSRSQPSSNEKLEIRTWPIAENTPWKRLPDMLHPSSRVSPCGYINCIYLFGDGVVEMFHCEDETFTPLTPSLSLKYPSYGVFHNGEILLLEENSIMKWNLEKNEVKSIRLVKQRGYVFRPYRTTAPILVDESLFVPDRNTTNIRKIDLVTGVVVLLTHQ